MKIREKKAVLVLRKNDSAVARFRVKLQPETKMLGSACFSVSSILLNPIATAPVLALKDNLEIPVPLLSMKLLFNMVELATLKMSRTASVKFLHRYSEFSQTA